MRCDVLPFGESGYVVVCSSRPRPPRRPCAYCDKPYEVFCDWPLPNGKKCDRVCCKDHSVRVADKTDYCEDHQREAERLKAMEF